MRRGMTRDDVRGGWNGSDVSRPDVVDDESADRALPRFALPNEELMAEPLDPSEVDATAPRPAFRESHSARRVRTASRSRPESTQEVAVEDILLEAYVEEPEPVSRQPSHATSLSPLTPKDLAEIEELLRDAPRPAPPAPLPPRPLHFTHSQHSYPPHPSAASAPFDTPSVAPVTFGSSSVSEPVRAPFGIPAAWPAPAPPPARSTRSTRSNRGVLFAIGAVAAFVACAVSVKIIRPMAALHASSATTSAVAATSAPEPEPAAKAEPKAESPAARAAPITAAASPSPPAVPTVAVDALPKASIPPDMTVLTLPPYAAGHRVFLDKALLHKASSPIRLKCGEHTIKIGSSGKPRLVDLPCGREFTLP